METDREHNMQFSGVILKTFYYKYNDFLKLFSTSTTNAKNATTFPALTA